MTRQAMTLQLTTAFVAATMRARGYRVLAGPDVPITGGAADSRRVRPGDLFGAFRGERVDGNSFVGEALAAGAVAAVCERAPEGSWRDATVVVAPDTVRAMADLAHAWRKACNPRVVGITGTVGKTTAKDLCAAVLAARFRTHHSEGNLNSREGLPLALMSLRRDHEVSVLEMAMDSKGEIADLCRIAEPEVGVVLNVGLTHVSKLGSIEAIEDEKLSLARSLPEGGTAVLNAGDARVASAIGQLKCRVIAFGPHGGATPTPALEFDGVTGRGLEGSDFALHYRGRTVQVHSPLAGVHTVPAALAAIGVALALGMSLDEAAAAVAVSGGAGRVHVSTSAEGATIVDDRYNSSPDSLAGALRLLRTLPGRRIALLGRMAELGEHEDDEHRQAGRIAAECCDLLVAVGEPCRLLVEEAKAAGLAEAYCFDDKRAAAAAVRERLRRGDSVLVKASRSQEFETEIPFLEGKA